MKKIFLTLMSCVVALAAYATVTEFDIDESSFIANDNTSSLTTANVTFSNGVARIEGNTSASNKRLHTNHLTLAAGKYSLSAWVKAESAAAKGRVGWTNPNPSDASKVVFNYDANPTTLSQGADYVEISMEFELSASTDVTLFVSNNGKTGNAILLNRLVLSSDGNSGTDPVTPPTGCTESGSCGDNLVWCYNSSTGTLTITGSGAMTEWSSDSPWYSFRSEITSVNLPDGLTSIGNGAFAGCTGLTSVTIPNSVTSIGKYAFYECTGLTSVTIPNSVTSIGGYAFLRCTGLTSITIPNSVTSIGNRAFEGCSSSLTSIKVEQNNTMYDSRDNCNAIIETSTNTLITGCQNTVIPNSVTSIGDGAFSDCTGLTSITIPNSVTSIGDWVFSDCTGLTSITIGSGVTSIGALVFFGCNSLTNIVWNAKRFSNDAYYQYNGSYYLLFDLDYDANSKRNITTFIFGDEVEIIPNNLCKGMTNITSISIPESVKTIGDYAFAGCTGLENLYCYRSMPPNAYSTAFDGVDKFSCVLHVPSASIDFYKNATAWRDFYYTTILGAETATTAVTSLEIIPHEDNADVMWPVVADAVTYEFTIMHDGAVVCTLKFNSEGQLMGIILHSVRAPAQNANHAPSNGFWFNVTGLENGSEYTLTILAKNSAGNVVRTFTQNFTTGATAIEEVNADGVALKPRKVLEEGRVIILMPDGRKFDANGRMLER